MRTFLALTLLVPIGTALFSLGAVANASVELTVILAEQLVIVDESGSRHDITVRQEGAKVVVRDTADRLRVNPDGVPGCTVAANVATCVGVGTTINNVAFVGGAGADAVTIDTPDLRVGMSGGPGDDTLTVKSGKGVSTLRGGPGKDTLRGGPARDLFLSEPTIDGADTIVGGAGVDRVLYGTRTIPVNITTDGLPNDGQVGQFGQMEFDNVAADVEEVEGSQSNDHLTGSAGANFLLGWDGNDVLNGGGGNDVLYGYTGADQMFGGDGNDVSLAAQGADGNDVFLGGAGIDTTSYADRSVAVVVRLDGRADDGSHSIGELDNQVDVENAVGTQLDDKLTGNAGNNVLTGGNGKDVLLGFDGNDSLRGDAGDDTIFGEVGNDTLIGGAGRDALDGGVGNDGFDGGADNDTMLGQDGNDTFHGGPGPTSSSTDDDLITGGLGGADLVSYNGRSAGVRVDGDNQPDDGVVGLERDTVSGSVENIAGGNGNDTLTGNAAANALSGQGGADRLAVNDGSPLKDTANGGAGTDTCLSDPRDARISCER